jgi:hypothetical protein
MTIEYQAWLSKSGIWVMIGFFPTAVDAQIKLDDVSDSAVSKTRVVEVSVWSL